ncbi:MAG TPA: hypothetical protein PK605_02345 [Ignavibacteria bacterium]|nr:hypothetical protein [Ignavibacteria bacterium]HRE12150.1 hypothetical protein [Ignavibacteria bacterium]HRF65768.1 hypothetical protein [Ignavibacteria bacterium]HRJ03221.1 hypothetical protein [Ignavibacteria bacterium]HRJ85143.1 hypothetical protein [Ignavibacteria bacterium]
MRKSVILFILILAYVWGCSGSEDKYDLIKSDDRKAIKSICNCIEPLKPYLDKMISSKDSLTREVYADSFEVKVLELAPCLEKVDQLENKFSGSEEYTLQFIDYIKAKHPNCVPYFLGESVSDSTNKQKTK